MADKEIPAPLHVAQMRVWETLGGKNSGIVGNLAHVRGFHRGADRVPASDYSRRRDPRGADGPYPNWAWCCAGDYHHGFKPLLLARHVVLLTRLMDDDPDLADVCEFIGKPWASKPVVYWARWAGVRTLARYTGAGHDHWSHVAVFRSRGASSARLWTPASAANGGPRSRRPAVLKAPAWPFARGFSFRERGAPRFSPVVRSWQARMRQRGWKIRADGFYGPRSAEVARRFQVEKKLSVDGLLGPKTFAAAWSLPVT